MSFTVPNTEDLSVTEIHNNGVMLPLQLRR